MWNKKKHHRNFYDLNFRRTARTKDTEQKGSRMSSSSESSSSSSESAYRHKAKFLGDKQPPVLVVTFKAVRNDNTKQGYQMVVYQENHSSKQQIQAYVMDISKTRWAACLDAVVVNPHEAQANLKWGQNCQDYKINIKAETGHFGNQPALRMTANWPKIPSKWKSTGKEVAEYVPGAMYMFGFQGEYRRNSQRQVKLVFALSSPRTCDVVMHIPRITVYYRALRLPVPIPVGHHAKENVLQTPTWNIFAEAPQIIMDSLQGECKVAQDQITTFNGVDLASALPENCYNVLAQDCSPEMKFMVLMRNSKESPNHKAINVKLGTQDIDMYYSADTLKMKINGLEVSEGHLPYKSFDYPAVEIKKKGNGVSLSASEYGIDSLDYDGLTIKFRPAMWMKGKTCGICGHNDDESEKELQMPDGSLAKDQMSFIHSWILPAESCSEGCNLQRSLVKLEKAIETDGAKAKCYSVQPVLRCAKGCSPVKTVEVSTGFHCLPSDVSLDLPEGQIRLDKSEDFSDKVEAHTACSCETSPCAA